MDCTASIYKIVPSYAVSAWGRSQDWAICNQSVNHCNAALNGQYPTLVNFACKSFPNHKTHSVETVKTSPQKQIMQITMSKITWPMDNRMPISWTARQAAGVHPDMLYRVKRTLAAVGIFGELSLLILFAKFV